MCKNASFSVWKEQKTMQNPHQNPMGFQLKSPTPGVFQSQFPTPMGDGGGAPVGFGDGGKTLVIRFYLAILGHF